MVRGARFTYRFIFHVLHREADSKEKGSFSLRLRFFEVFLFAKIKRIVINIRNTIDVTFHGYSGIT